MAILINLAVFSYLFLGSLHMNQNRFSQPCRSFLAYPPCDRRNLFSLSWTSFMFSIGFFVVPKALRLPVAGVDLDEGLVEPYPARENPPSWHLSMAENTFTSQYFSALSAFLLSRADVLAEWKSKRWSRNSTHSESGIFVEPNSVPVSGLNERPHPQNGHFLGKAKARPKWVLFFSSFFGGLLSASYPVPSHYTIKTEFISHVQKRTFKEKNRNPEKRH